MNYIIRQPVSEEDFRQYFELRWRVLRSPWKQPQGSEKDEMEGQCFHLLAEASDATIIGCVRLQLNTEEEAQVRYMAVDTTWQGRGVGRMLLNGAEAEAIRRGCRKIILHARENALQFYESGGYRITGTSYLLFDEIQHYLMEKTINIAEE